MLLSLQVRFRHLRPKMKTSTLTFSYLLGYFSSVSAIPHSHYDPSKGSDLSVHTSSGYINGKIDSATPHVRQFLGIPFAQPPIGALRFAPPVALPQSAASNNVQAIELPPSCLQYLNPNSPSVYVDQILEFNLQGLNRTGAVSEDCLTLSVWTPTVNATQKGHGGPGNSNSKAKNGGLLPVLIFIYGGGFVNGGQDVPYQLPPQWVERTQDHIVVSFKYVS